MMSRDGLTIVSNVEGAMHFCTPEMGSHVRRLRWSEAGVNLSLLKGKQ